MVIEPPNTEVNIDCYIPVAGGVALEEMRWNPMESPMEILSSEKWKRCYVVTILREDLIMA